MEGLKQQQQQQEQQTVHESTINVAVTKASGGKNNVKVTAAAAAAGVTEWDKVRRVGVSEYKQAAMCLAEAFEEDEVARYFTHTPDREHWTEKQRWDLHVCILEYIVYAHILKGLVLSVGENYGCVALWMPPGQNMDDYATILRSGLWRLHYKLSREGKTRFFDEFFTLLHDTKVSVLGARDNESYYLVYIGTKPEARGRGLARKNIEAVTRIADREGRVCYLESSNAVNPVIYRKLGFEVVGKIGLVRAAKEVEMEVMVREPRGLDLLGQQQKQKQQQGLEKVDSLIGGGGVVVGEEAGRVEVKVVMGREKEVVGSIALV